MSAGSDLADVFRTAFDNWLPQVCDDARINTAQAIFDSTPLGESGRLRADESSDGSMGGQTYEANFRSHAPYSSFVDLGRGPVTAQHTRTTKDGREVPGVLRFKIGGQWIYRHSVGPSTPRDFFVTKIPDLWASRLFESLRAIPL